MSLTVEKCMQAWTNSLRQMNARADIVFFGDSLTYYGDFSSVFPEKVVCNLGLRGDTISGMIDRIEQVSLLHPKKVFLMTGINDIANLSNRGFEKIYESLLTRIINDMPNVILYVQSILPVNDRDFTISCNNVQIKSCNDSIRLLAVKYNLVFIDLYLLYENEGYLPKNITKDGIHLTLEAYSIWYSFLSTNID